MSQLRKEISTSHSSVTNCPTQERKRSSYPQLQLPNMTARSVLLGFLTTIKCIVLWSEALLDLVFNSMGASGLSGRLINVIFTQGGTVASLFMGKRFIPIGFSLPFGPRSSQSVISVGHIYHGWGFVHDVDSGSFLHPRHIDYFFLYFPSQSCASPTRHCLGLHANPMWDYCGKQRGVEWWSCGPKIQCNLLGFSSSLPPLQLP